MHTPRMKLDRKSAVVLVVDIQERLLPAMRQDELESVFKYTKAMIGAARELDIPILATEQYPKGLGPTAPAIRELLPAAPLVKTHFSCGADPEFQKALAATGRKQVIIVGMETHVCVFQTARDLVEHGYDVYVCADAVTSRFAEHRRVGLDLIQAAGALVTTAETAIFDLLHQAATPEFKKVSQLVR